MTNPLPLTRAALASLDARRATPADVADAFVAETAAYNRADDAREVVESEVGLRWLRETFGQAGGAR